MCVHSRCPWLSERFSVAIPIYNGVIFLFVLANFCMATFMDPGIFPRGMEVCVMSPGAPLSLSAVVVVTLRLGLRSHTRPQLRVARQVGVGDDHSAPQHRGAEEPAHIFRRVMISLWTTALTLCFQLPPTLLSASVLGAATLWRRSEFHRLL